MTQTYWRFVDRRQHELTEALRQGLGGWAGVDANANGGEAQVEERQMHQRLRRLDEYLLFNKSECML